MDQYNLKFEIKNLSGEVIEYNLLPLRRKTAAYVSHTFLQTLLKSFARASKGGVEELLGAISDIEFDTVWELASTLLKEAEIRHPKGIERINNLDDSDYFRDNPEELYLAIIHGIQANYPKFFSKARGFLADLAQRTSGLMTDQTSTPEISSTP